MSTQDKKHAIDDAAFRAYIDLFNQHRYKEVPARYYAEDVRLELPQDTLIGPQAIVENYDIMTEYLDEQMEILWLLTGPDAIATELDVRFTCVKDYPDFQFKPMKKGDTLRFTSWIHYTLRDGKMSLIRVTLATQPEFGRLA